MSRLYLLACLAIISCSALHCSAQYWQQQQHPHQLAGVQQWQQHVMQQQQQPLAGISGDMYSWTSLPIDIPVSGTGIPLSTAVDQAVDEFEKLKLSDMQWQSGEPLAVPLGSGAFSQLEAENEKLKNKELALLLGHGKTRVQQAVHTRTQPIIRPMPAFPQPPHLAPINRPMRVEPLKKHVNPMLRQAAVTTQQPLLSAKSQLAHSVLQHANLAGAPALATGAITTNVPFQQQQQQNVPVTLGVGVTTEQFNPYTFQQSIQQQQQQPNVPVSLGVESMNQQFNPTQFQQTIQQQQPNEELQKLAVAAPKQEIKEEQPKETIALSTVGGEEKVSKKDESAAKLQASNLSPAEQMALPLNLSPSQQWHQLVQQGQTLSAAAQTQIAPKPIEQQN